MPDNYLYYGDNLDMLRCHVGDTRMPEAPSRR